jgi:hypothetical protein
MKKITLFSFAVIAFTSFVHAQNQNVGVGTLTPNASAMLDVVSTSKGVLVPRMNTAQMNAITSPANGLMIYNTDSLCFCYYKSLAWVSLCNSGSGGSGATGPTGPTGAAGSAGATGPTGPAGSNGATGATGPTGTSGSNGATGPTGPTGPSQTAWWILGNSGTSAGTNFVGTTDAQDFVTKTNNIERMRVNVGGPVVTNNPTPAAGDVFSVYGTGYAGAISPLGDFAVNGYVSGTGIAVYGEQGGTGQGVYGLNSSSGAGVVGNSTSGYGVVGVANGTLITAVRGANTNAAGTGIIALGNNVTPGTVLTGGTGLAANGTHGLFSLGTNATNGNGVVGVGNGSATIYTNPSGSGVTGTGSTFGVTGYCTTTTNSQGGYFDCGSANGYAYVGLNFSGTDYKINGGGAVATIVKDLDGKNKNMICPEAPEALFQDFGTGQLANGSTHITIDPVFAKNVFIDDKHPLRVFVQLEGDCKGVFVTNKTQNGFDVIELDGGKSNVKFTWQITANRIDAKDESGKVVSHYQDIRFPPAPDRMTPEKMEAQKVNQSNTLISKPKK